MTTIEGKVTDLQRSHYLGAWHLTVWINGVPIQIEEGPSTTSFLLAYAQPGRESATWRAEIDGVRVVSIVRVGREKP